MNRTKISLFHVCLIMRSSRKETNLKGNPKFDKNLKDTENVPIRRGKACLASTEEYFAKEVVPFAPDAWYDKKKMKVGYEIAFNKYFYKYEALRPLSEIANDILALENETKNLLNEIVE